MIKRNASSSVQQHQDTLRKQIHRNSAVDFFNVLTGPLLLEMTEAHLPVHRERLYPPTVVLSMFIKQVLAEDGSCQRAVNGWTTQRAAEGLTPQMVEKELWVNLLDYNLMRLLMADLSNRDFNLVISAISTPCRCGHSGQGCISLGGRTGSARADSNSLLRSELGTDPGA